MYGPAAPIPFATVLATEIPVCRRHVGYISIVCSCTMKNIIAIKNFIPNVEAVASIALLGTVSTCVCTISIIVAPTNANT